MRVLSRVWRQWIHFWFAAGDPTTMAFVRIVTGVLVVYVHAVYTTDLYSFFGRNAWFGLADADHERHETPLPVYSFWEWEWEEPQLSLRLPDEPHLKIAVLNFIRSLPLDDRPRLDAALRLMDCEADAASADPVRLDRLGYASQYDEEVLKSALLYLPNLSPKNDIRRTTLNALADPRLRDKNDQFPEVLTNLPDTERRRKTDHMDEFYQWLPKTQHKDEELGQRKGPRNFVLEYFIERDGQHRRNFLRFVRELSNMNTEARKDRLDYLAYWNYDKKYAQRLGTPVFSIWFHIVDENEMAAAHGVVLIIMILFTIGLWTRITSVLTWLTAVSYIHRNPQVLFGQDTMMNILLIYLMVSNCGAALSVDRWLACRRARRLSMARSGTIDARTQAFLDAPPPSASTAFAQRLLQVHFCFIYLAAGLSKLKGPAWWNHSAFWDTLINPEFTMVHFQWYENLLRWTASSRPVFAISAALGVWFTLFIEISLPFLVWTRLRPWAVAMGFLLHAGVGVFMGLLVFSLMMMVMLMGYLPGAAVRAMLFPKKEIPS